MMDPMQAPRIGSGARFLFDGMRGRDEAALLSSFGLNPSANEWVPARGANAEAPPNSRFGNDGYGSAKGGGKDWSKGASKAADKGRESSMAETLWPRDLRGSLDDADVDQPKANPVPLTPADLLGNWADSLGNAVLVISTDAYKVKLTAILSKKERPDVNLCMKPVPGGGWTCGNAKLDPVWSSMDQLHWITADGRISVWVRPEAGTEESKQLQDSILRDGMHTASLAKVVNGGR